MGADASKSDGGPSQPDGDGSAPDGDTDSRAATDAMYAKVIAGEVDAAAAFEEALRDDVEMADGIRQLAEQIAAGKGDKTAVGEEFKKLEKMAKEQERKEKVADAAATKQAGRGADDWLERQVREGRAAEQAARAAAEQGLGVKIDAAAAVAERLRQEQEELARGQARREAMAREALLEGAGQAKLLAAMRLGRVGEGTVPCPHQPAAPGHATAPGGEDVAPPEPPPLPVPGSAPKSGEEVPEFYKLLNVSVDATFDEIKRGYRVQALRWHPDKNRNRLEAATERFKKISEAFDTLYDPKKREDYDSGKACVKGKAKKLQGHGWSSKNDEDDETFTPLGVKYKKMSWRGYILLYGRIDDDPAQIVQDENDPRAPQEKIKVFWRLIGEYAHIAREESTDKLWLHNFVASVWKDTPSKWPGAVELKNMNDAAQQEWQERRMVFNRRKQKVLIHISLHQDYLDIPDREEKEIARISRKRPGWSTRMGMNGPGLQGTDPFRPTG